MAQIMKHVGAFGNRPCLVLFREVPNEPENCLIVETSTLNPQMHDDLMMHVQSAEAQESHEVSEVLARKTLTDGTNALNTLHYNKLIKKVPVNQVNLTPIPGQSIPLSEVNAEIRKIASGAENTNTAPERQAATEQARVTTSEVEGTPANEASQTAEEASEPSVAQGLLVQGQLMLEDAKAMMADAESKMQQAYAMDPSLAPKRGPGRPKKSS
jgi:hypothetical protein